jgi:hypothetical protein
LPTQLLAAGFFAAAVPEPYMLMLAGLIIIEFAARGKDTA